MSIEKSRKARVSFRPEQKLDYVKLMVVENYSAKQIMEISGAGATAVTRWKKQYLEELEGRTPEGKKALTPVQQHIQELEKQLWRARRDNEILKKIALISTGQQGIKLIVQMKKANENYTITELCSLFNIKLSTYYYQQQEKPLKPDVEKMMTAIKMIAIETDNSYGKLRIHKVLQLQGFQKKAPHLLKR